MKSWPFAFVSMTILTTVATFSGPAAAGGWVVSTADALPASIVADHEFPISFVVRQHGLRPANWGPMQLSFTHGKSGETITVTATVDPATLQYHARVALPDVGIWSWSVNSSLIQPMGSIVVETASGGSAAEQDPIAEGRNLFQSKGCIICHQQSAVARIRRGALGQFEPFTGGPDLSDYHVVPEFLKLWLADPTALKPKTQMPDLGLSGAEIEALIRFLGSE